jgi:hypothetical protein
MVRAHNIRVCPVCQKERVRIWRSKNPEKVKQYNLKAQPKKRDGYLNKDVFLETGIRLNTRCLSLSYHKMPFGLDATKTKLIAYQDISSCEKNYLGMESEILRQSELNLVVLNIDELLNYIQ